MLATALGVSFFAKYIGRKRVLPAGEGTIRAVRIFNVALSFN